MTTVRVNYPGLEYHGRPAKVVGHRVDSDLGKLTVFTVAGFPGRFALPAKNLIPFERNRRGLNKKVAALAAGERSSKQIALDLGVDSAYVRTTLRRIHADR